MSETNMTITEFLEARIAEDEAEVEKGWDHNGTRVFARDNYGCLLIKPARVLAECAAKRAIIDLHRGVKFHPPSGDETWPYVHTFHSDGDVRIMKDGKEVERLWSIPEYLERFGIKTIVAPELRALAAVYASHPDYREGWAL